MTRPLTEADALNRWGNEFITALAFLTRIPAGGWMPADAPPLAQAMRAFPIVGMLLGLFGGLILWIASAVGSPPLLAAAISLTALIFLTGALHEDGLADMMDGLGGGQDREDRLAIMRDSRIGTFGVVALALMLMAKGACLADFTSRNWYLAPAIMAGAGTFSRSLIVWLMGATPPARHDGLSAAAGQPSWDTARTALLIGGIGGGLLLALAGGIIMAVFALSAGWAAAAVVRTIAIQRIGGQTGDVCGGVQVLSETAILAVAATMLP
jgi:adenosylcobinamide-GDP ribazoletransferase